MRQFDGSSWNNVAEDTGWRDISSYSDVVGTFDYDPEYHSYDYNINIAGTTVTAYIRRVYDRVTFVVDMAVPSSATGDSVYTANIFPDVPDSPLIKIGLPLASASSDQITRYSLGENSKYSDQRRTAEAMIVWGRAYTVADSVGLVIWDRDYYDETNYEIYSRRFTMSWYTPDPFPTEPVGVKMQ